VDLQIYCGNLQHGGIAVQAASFLDQIPAMVEGGALKAFDRILVKTSTLVARNMDNMALMKSCGIDVKCWDDRPFPALGIRQRSGLRLVYSGPDYLIGWSGIELAGFADAYIAPRVAKLTLERAKTLDGWKRSFQRLMLRKYDAFFTETEWVAEQLEEFMPGHLVRVIPNAPADLFRLQPPHDEQDVLRRPDSDVVLFYPARGYAHKNHRRIPGVARAFERLTGSRMTVITTLRDRELTNLGLHRQPAIHNIGEVSVDQLPALYSCSDGLFFPSLLEVSSVTPLEAMMMLRPVIAADTVYNRINYREHAFYFDPTDDNDAAHAILRALESDTSITLSPARAFVLSLPTAQERALMVADLCLETLNVGPGDRQGGARGSAG